MSNYLDQLKKKTYKAHHLKLQHTDSTDYHARKQMYLAPTMHNVGLMRVFIKALKNPDMVSFSLSISYKSSYSRKITLTFTHFNMAASLSVHLPSSLSLGTIQASFHSELHANRFPSSYTPSQS